MAADLLGKAINLLYDLDEKKLKKLTHLVTIHSSLINSVVPYHMMDYHSYGARENKSLLAYAIEIAIEHDVSAQETQSLLVQKFIKLLVDRGAPFQKVNNHNVYANTILYYSMPIESLFMYFLDKGSRFSEKEINELKTKPHTYQKDRISFYESFIEKHNLENSIQVHNKSQLKLKL